MLEKDVSLLKNLATCWSKNLGIRREDRYVNRMKGTGMVGRRFISQFSPFLSPSASLCLMLVSCLGPLSNLALVFSISLFLLSPTFWSPRQFALWPPMWDEAGMRCTRKVTVILLHKHLKQAAPLFPRSRPLSGLCPLAGQSSLQGAGFIESGFCIGTSEQKRCPQLSSSRHLCKSGLSLQPFIFLGHNRPQLPLGKGRQGLFLDYSIFLMRPALLATWLNHFWQWPFLCHRGPV